jgi:hypothetical protein
MYIYLLARRASMPVIFVEEEVEEEGWLIDCLAREAAAGGPAAAHFVGHEPPLNQAILCH